jgi:hypothetical protein
MTDLPKPFVCSICGELILGEWGNNAWPINEGRCCNTCNDKVIIARVSGLYSKEKKT